MSDENDNSIIRLVTDKKNDKEEVDSALSVFETDDDFVHFSTFALNQVEVEKIKGAVTIVVFDDDGADDVIFAKAHLSESLLPLVGALDVMKSSLLGEVNLVGGLDEG